MNTKKELKTFFTWLRNGTCFAVTWFLILELIVRWISGVDTISIVNLTKTIVWTVGGVLIFCVAFTRLFIRRFGFVIYGSYRKKSASYILMHYKNTNRNGDV